MRNGTNSAGGGRNSKSLLQFTVLVCVVIFIGILISINGNNLGDDPSRDVDTGSKEDRFFFAPPLDTEEPTEILPSGSLSPVFSETFEASFPDVNWYVGDWESTCDSDYWGVSNYRPYAGTYSCWCAQIGDNSYYGGTNAANHRYDNYMNAYLIRRYATDASAWDVGYVDFYAWSSTESGYDYLDALWYSVTFGGWVEDSSQKIQGSSAWTRTYWKMPYSYLNSTAAFGFGYHSDEIVCTYEGIYVDNVQFVRADLTIEASSYISPTSLVAGNSFTMYYYIHNPCPFSVSCGLGASIYSASTGWIDDPTHDAVVSLPSGYSWQSRTFSVPSAAPVGTYDVGFGIWSSTPGITTNGNRMWGSLTKTGALSVVTQPDLIITDIYLNVSPPTGYQSVTISAIVRNQGGSTASNFYVEFWNDAHGGGTPVNLGSSFISSLGSGTSTTASVTVSSIGPGYHMLEARADTTNAVTESNEDNNWAWGEPGWDQFTWFRGPDLIITNIWWFDAYNVQDGAITSGQPFKIWWQVRNNGDANAIGTFRTVLTVGGFGDIWADITNLNVGATRDVYSDLYLSSLGSHTLIATVDTLGAISEANT
ncbi:MAG: hypothetical protein JW839_15540, partial [Candidatus Lokiarchaeota archaeon]|nr:hypothetical protein [Candidatus Lokiarchaeota archaeon]